jgi:hypothetical protein
MSQKPSNLTDAVAAFRAARNELLANLDLHQRLDKADSHHSDVIRDTGAHFVARSVATASVKAYVEAARQMGVSAEEAKAEAEAKIMDLYVVPAF